MTGAALVKRIAASSFVLIGGLAIVKYLWPEEITELPLTALGVELILRAAGAAIAALISLGLVWSFWKEK
jgi:hypothetical protein